MYPRSPPTAGKNLRVQPAGRESADQCRSVHPAAAAGRPYRQRRLCRILRAESIEPQGQLESSVTADHFFFGVGQLRTGEHQTLAGGLFLVVGNTLNDHAAKLLLALRVGGGKLCIRFQPGDVSVRFLNVSREFGQQLVLQAEFLALMVGFQNLEFCDLNIQIHLLLDERISGTQCLDAVNNDLTALRQSGKIKLTGTAVTSPALPNTLSFEGHAIEQMGKRQISLAQANEIAEHAILAISQRNGTQHAYYSEKGFIVIRQDGSIGTVGWLDDAGKQIVEVMKQHGF